MNSDWLSTDLISIKTWTFDMLAELVWTSGNLNGDRRKCEENVRGKWRKWKRKKGTRLRNVAHVQEEREETDVRQLFTLLGTIRAIDNQDFRSSLQWSIVVGTAATGTSVNHSVSDSTLFRGHDDKEIIRNAMVFHNSPDDGDDFCLIVTMPEKKEKCIL